MPGASRLFLAITHVDDCLCRLASDPTSQVECIQIELPAFASAENNKPEDLAFVQDGGK